MAEGNIFVSNLGLNPVVNFNFMLRVEGVMDVPCKSVHSFTKENEYEYIQEGGLNDYVHMKRKPISRPFTFQVERYVGVDYIDPLPNGAELVLPLFLFVSRSPGNFATGVIRCYTFTGCIVTGKEFGALQSESSGLLTETATIAYRELLVVNIPLNDLSVEKISDLVEKAPAAAAVPRYYKVSDVHAQNQLKDPVTIGVTGEKAEEEIELPAAPSDTGATVVRELDIAQTTLRNKQAAAEVRTYDIAAENLASQQAAATARTFSATAPAASIVTEDEEEKELDLAELLKQDYLAPTASRLYDIPEENEASYQAPATPRIFDPAAKLVIQEPAEARIWSAQG